MTCRGVFVRRFYAFGARKMQSCVLFFTHPLLFKQKVYWSSQVSRSQINVLKDTFFRRPVDTTKREREIEEKLRKTDINSEKPKTSNQLRETEENFYRLILKSLISWTT